MDFRNAITSLIGSAGEPYDTVICALILFIILTTICRCFLNLIRKLSHQS